MPRVTLTAAERKAGLDLRDVIRSTPRKKRRKPIAPTKKQKLARQKRESKLLNELCAKHAYSMQDAPKGKRIQMMFEHDKKKNLSRVVPMYCVILMVPDDSALGEQLVARYKEKPSATKGPR